MVKADDVFGAQAEIDVAEIPERSCEERGSGEQEHRECDLAGDENFAEADVGNAGGARSSLDP